MSKEAAQEQNQSTFHNDEITIKELILKLQEYWKNLWKNKFWIIAAAILGASLFLANAFLAETNYRSRLTFMINEDESGKGGGIGSLLGQFGLGGGSSGGKYNLDKIIALSKSRNILQEVMFVKTKLGDKEDYIANHIIDLYDFHDKWAENVGLNGFYFQRDSLALFDRIENTALLNVYSQIIGNKSVDPILLPSYDDDTKVLILNTVCKSEELSIQILDTVYNRLSLYYVSRAIEPQYNTYFTLKAKTDSLQNRLQSIRYSIAKFSDTNRKLLDNTSSIRLEGLRVDQTITATAYGEAIKNLELADFTLRNETPVFQIIDAPIIPASRVPNSKSKAIILGGFLGVFFACFFFVLRKIFRDIMSE